MSNINSLQIVVGKCSDLLVKINAASDFLGIPGYHPEEPKTLETARTLLEDLKYLRFDLRWKAEALAEGLREVEECHRHALEYAADCRVRIENPNLPWHMIVQIVDATVQRRSQTSQKAA